MYCFLLLLGDDGLGNEGMRDLERRWRHEVENKVIKIYCYII